MEKFNLFEDGKGDGANTCIVCGKKVSPYVSLFVEIGIDGFEFGTTDETESQGGFKIGSTCVKNFTNVWGESL